MIQSKAFTLDDVFRSDCQHILNTPFDYDEFDETETSLQQKLPRKPNEFGYKFGNVYNANWYRQFRTVSFVPSVSPSRREAENVPLLLSQQIRRVQEPFPLAPIQSGLSN
jgi:hypothetical protein